MSSMQDETIAAIATTLGEGGISIVRLSGNNSFSVVDRIFCPAKKQELSKAVSHSVHYGFIKEPGTEEIIDEVLVTVMRAPRTYTRENVVEINCHGGIIPSQRVLQLCMKHGARLAEPGEFTKRAFLNGRIDLSQAEAVLEIIQSETNVSAEVSARQLRGEFSEKIHSLRFEIQEILALTELTIDFSQEDVEFPQSCEIAANIRRVVAIITDILNTADKGMILRQGASVVICGRPNVGKSSLMNALLKHERVIVAPVAGTTRDVIEEYINIGGVKIKLSDTAGIIKTRNKVEEEGIKRSIDKISKADIVVFLLDYSCLLSERDKEIFEKIKNKQIVIAANKSDLPRKLNVGGAGKCFGGEKILKLSVLKKKGLEEIEDALAKKLFKNNMTLPEGPIITNIRHKNILEKCAKSVKRALKIVEENYNAELLASDLNEAVYQLGLIIGETAEDDVLDRIFSQFCIGK
ncbi:MAG: tRNA uridine-5-carboxymethylaminomethyl(34) synthesis GTPase MnmE [Candidatus Omnitrophota bacterium]|nr:tRNA uridine-5-carboxymethylaminomethyl(34) synthesis GTPase MnmE [Candidatus Omnitrophota bacterium]MBU1894886.1 tRNA uridine-5-carboxymethylaminomethyl(34) synthesis GTPase MnmE [Candidatus Omnitrophota bacterium]